MRTDYVITVTYENDPKPLVFDYRSGWTLGQVQAWASKKYRYAHVATTVNVVVAPAYAGEPCCSEMEADGACREHGHAAKVSR
jgi:hypothetical protein